MCISVLLPLPELPMMATYSPATMSRSTVSSARTALSTLAVDLADAAQADDR